GRRNGVFFTDSSLLKRFFEEPVFNVKTPYVLESGLRIVHRVAFHSWWNGRGPSPEALIKQFEEPFQLKLLQAHTRSGPGWFTIGQNILAATTEFVRDEMTIESAATVGGASESWIRQEIASMARNIKELRVARDRRLLLRQTRAWRERERRER